jgi:hypothetical protein
MSITKEEIKKLIGHTWFDITDEGDFFDLSSRHYGDVGECEPGDPDIEEARRIGKILRPLGYKITGDIVDEWVSVQVSKTKNGTGEKEGE